METTAKIEKENDYQLEVLHEAECVINGKSSKPG
jgi:hypothetical protein